MPISTVLSGIRALSHKLWLNKAYRFIFPRPVLSRPDAHDLGWRNVKAPFEVHDALSMLAYEERDLLYYLTKLYYRGVGEIIDGGAWLGGSTMALAAGLRDRPDPLPKSKVHAYDRFIADTCMVREYFPNEAHMKPGDSFLPIYQRITAGHRKRIVTHTGDIDQLGWDGRPIEVMFLDILKSWNTNDSVMRDFYPALIPGISVVVHQDYVHEWCPWILISMELFADHFELLDFVHFSSVVFLHTKQISRSDIPASLAQDLSHDEQIRLLDAAIARFAAIGRYPRYCLGVMEVCKARLFQYHGRWAESYEYLENIVRRYPDDYEVFKCAGKVRNTLV